MELPSYESRHVILFVDDERLRYEPDGLGPVGYSDPGPFNPANLRPESARGRDLLFDRQGRAVTRIEGVIASAQLSLDLTMERDYGDDGALRERALVAHVVLELRLTDGRAYDVSTDGEVARFGQTDGFGVGR